MHGWMDDYSALAQRISVSVPEMRACIILSRDGMVLGAFPDGDESVAKLAWLRFIALGEPERSFVEFADQTWAFVRRGPYAAFAVAEPGVRPGVMVDRLEQAMFTAEEGRARRDTLRVPDAANAPSGKPRTSLHPGGGKDGKDAKDGKDGKDGKGKDKDRDRDRTKPVEVTAEAAPARGAWSRGTPAASAGAPSGEGTPLDAVVEADRAGPRRAAPTGSRGGAGDGAQEGAAEADRERFRRRRGGDGGRPGPSGQRVLGIASAGLWR